MPILRLGSALEVVTGITVILLLAFSVSISFEAVK